MMPAYSETSPTALPHDLVSKPTSRDANAPEDDAADLTLGAGCRLDCEELERAARLSAPRIRLSARSQEAMDASRGILLRRQAAGDAIYGVTTGFGPFVRYNSAANGQAAHGEGLIAHLGAGWGPCAPADVVRASMLLRVHTLAQGWSGVRPNVVEGYIEMLAKGIVPSVPIIGSVGASGDLIPLAHIARALCGQGDVLCTANTADAAVCETGNWATAAQTETDTRAAAGTMPAAHALNAAGMTPRELDGRDALALTNGTAFLTAYASLAVARAERLIARAEDLTGWLYRALGCRASALDPRLHQARGHTGQRQSAAAIRAEAGRYGAWEDTTRPLQEIYSLRCAPQVLGACRENLAFARRLIETELNGISDNPLCGMRVGQQALDVEHEAMSVEREALGLEMEEEGAGGDVLEAAVLEEAMLHGGNFHGQQVAFAADALNAALTQAGLLADRQLDALLDPRINGGAPLLLAWEPGATSGMAGAQITATALAAEMRTHAQAYALSSIPTNGGNQDIVSMGTLAARMALEQTDRLAPLLAILGMALVQLGFLREQERAPNAPTPTPAWMPPFAPFAKDRALRQDITRIAQAWLLPAQC